jgi:hypothetical protein
MESLLPAPLVLEEGCDSFYCCDNEAVDHSISALAEMLTELSLKTQTKSTPGEIDVFTISVLAITSNSLQRIHKIFYLRERSLKFYPTLSIMRFRIL